MKKSFSMWRAGLAAACAMMGFVAVAEAEPFVVGWGMNANGQAAPVPVAALSGATDIAAGYHHSLAVVDSCTYAWGLDDYGQSTVPTAGRTNVVAVAAGEGFSAAIRNDGTLAAWGRSDVAGKLVGDYVTDVKQISAGENHILVLKKDGKVMATGTNSYAAECTVPAEALSGVVQVAAGARFSLALKDDGTIVSWGDAEQDGGTLAVPSSLQGHAKSIAAGHYHALAITDAGNLVEWGWVGEGHAIPTAVKTGATAIAAGYDFSMAIASDGKVYVWGDDTEGQLSSMPASVKASDSSRIAAGYGHCLVLGAGLAPYWLGDSVPDEAYVARAYSGSVSATGMPAVTYHQAGNWPAWLKLDRTTGVLSGTPAKTAAVARISVVASNIYGTVTNIFPVHVSDTPVDPPAFITTVIPDAEVGLYYSFRIQASNSPLFHAIDTGSYPLPNGLELSENGTLSGTPTAEYDSIFYVMASNITASVTTNYLMHVGAPSAAPEILTRELPDALLGEPWSVQIETDREASFAIVAGQCPAGLDIEPATGVISGTPSESGDFAFTVQAANSVGATTAAYDLAVNAAPAITTDSLPGGSVGANYSQAIAATGWPVPAFALASGTLPAGLSLDAAGTLSGKPSAAGTYAFSVSAGNSAGTDTRSYTVVVDSLARPQFTSMSFTSNKVTLTWANGATNTYLEWSTNAAAASPVWKNLGKKSSPWTGSVTNGPVIHYRLRNR